MRKSLVKNVPVDDGDKEWRKEYRRLTAIAKQHRRGNKQHAGDKAFEKSISSLESLIRRHESRLNSIKQLQELANSPIAKLIQKLNPPKGYETVAVFDFDEVSFCYENEETGHIIDLPWLFNQTHIWPDDCEAAGIRVE